MIVSDEFDLEQVLLRLQLEGACIGTEPYQCQLQCLICSFKFSFV